MLLVLCACSQLSHRVEAEILTKFGWIIDDADRDVVLSSSSAVFYERQIALRQLQISIIQCDLGLNRLMLGGLLDDFPHLIVTTFLLFLI